jgi:hypothetical protein
LNNNDALLRATWAAEIPELSGLPPDQFQAGLAMLAQVDPPRFEKAVNLLKSFSNVTTAQAHHNQYMEQQQQQKLFDTVKAEDARTVEMLGEKGADEATKAIHTFLKDHGIRDPHQMFQVIKANPVLATAEARIAVQKAAKYDAMMNAPKPRAHQSLPPVQKPGVTAPRASNYDTSLRSLDRQLSAATSESQQIKIARQILALKEA